MKSKVKMKVIAGWWKMKIGPVSFKASYVDEFFPVTFLEALIAWKEGKTFALEFDGEYEGHVLFIRPLKGNKGHLIVSKFENYFGGFGLPIDPERANVEIQQGSSPGEFQISYECNFESSELPQGLWIHQEEINIEEFVQTLLYKTSRLINRAGGLDSFFSKHWISNYGCYNLRSKRRARKIQRKKLWKPGYDNNRPGEVTTLSEFTKTWSQLEII